MGIFKRIGDLFRSEKPVAKPMFAPDAHVSLRSMRGEKLYEVEGDARMRITPEEDKEHLTLFVRNGNAETYHEVMHCHLPNNNQDRNELVAMLNTVREDIYESLRHGPAELRIPTNEYDLYMYIKRRPSIPIDMDDLEKELSEGQTGTLVKSYRAALEQGSRMDVYIVRNSSLSNDTAMQILKNAWKDFPMIHFRELENPSGEGYLFWTSKLLQDILKKEFNVAVIGIGVMGKKPPYCLELKTDENSSIVQKASLLVDHHMNVREEMIDAQASFHAAGINYVCQRRQIEYIDKIVGDLAIEEAAYRIPREVAQDIVASVQDVLRKNPEDLPILKIPQFDQDLLLNLVVRADEGFMVEVEGQEVLYYNDYMGKLKDLYGWMPLDDSWLQAPDDVTLIELESEAKLVSIEGKYVRDMNETLTNNVGKSIISSFESVRALVEHYAQRKLDAVHQAELLEYVDAVQKYGYGESIANMIHEILR